MNLVVIYGPPAAGKLTVAKELSNLTGYTLLDNHKFIDPIAELFPWGVPEYEEARTELARKVRLDAFATAAKVGKNLITTAAPFAPGARDFLFDIKKSVETANGNACFVFLSPKLEILQERVSAPSRVGKKADTVKRLHEMLELNPLLQEKLEGFEHLATDNSDLSPQDAAHEIVKYYSLPLCESPNTLN